jgi:CheY-like chemotaxis protein
MSPTAILCVDDEAIILLALKNELRMAFGSRFIYETALSAGQALATLEQLRDEGVRIVLVISDWLMPGIKGDEFLAIVREKYPETKAIMVTGQADEETIDALIKAGNVRSILKKPWRSEELIRVVASYCGA